MRKKTNIIVLIIIISLFASACGKSSKKNGQAQRNPNISVENQSKLDALDPIAYSDITDLKLEPGSYISIIGRYSGDSYWKQVEAGAKQAVDDLNKELGYKGKNKIKVDFCAPDKRDDVNEQINILDEELARYPVAIAIAPIDPTACHVQFEMAADNNISIVTLDSGTDYLNIISHISTNNVKASQKAAKEIATLMEKKGEVAIFLHDSRSTTAVERENSFKEVIEADYPKISIVDTYHLNDLEFYSNQMAEEQNAQLEEGEKQVTPDSFSQKDIIKYIIEKNPDLKAIYTTNLDTTQLVSEVLKSMKKTDLIFVGFDGGTEQTKLLLNDTLSGLIVQNPYAMGYASIVAIVRNVMGLGNEAYVDSGYIWVTKKNMNNDKILPLLY